MNCVKTVHVSEDYNAQLSFFHGKTQHQNQRSRICILFCKPLNILTQTLSLKSHKNQFAKCLHVRLFKCSNCMVKQIGNTCTETCNSCSVIFHFSVIHPKDQCRTENLSLFQIDDQVNQICPYIFKVYHLFGKYLVEVRKRPEDQKFLSTTQSLLIGYFFFTSYLIYLYLCYNE